MKRSSALIKLLKMTLRTHFYLKKKTMALTTSVRKSKINLVKFQCKLSTLSLFLMKQFKKAILK